jgi:hypothetical protein
MKNMELVRPANAWVKRRSGPDEIVRIVPEGETKGIGQSYKLYAAFSTMGSLDLPDEQNTDFLGRVLFDTEGYWIYDGEFC